MEDKSRIIITKLICRTIGFIIFVFGLCTLFIAGNPFIIRMEMDNNTKESFDKLDKVNVEQSNTELWACHNGCLFAEWFVFGKNNLTKSSNLYNQCAKDCWKEYNPNYSIVGGN